jgi:hypothetical protein
MTVNKYSNDIGINTTNPLSVFVQKNYWNTNNTDKYLHLFLGS